MAIFLGVLLGLYLVAGDGYIVFSWVTVLIVGASAWVADLVLRPLLSGVLVAIMGTVAWVSTRLGLRKRRDEYAETVNPTSGLPESIHEAVEAASDEARKRADKASTPD